MLNLAQIHYRDLEHDKTSALAANAGNYEIPLHLSATSVEELQWWVLRIPHAQRHISHGLPGVIIQSDASKKGWGAVFEGQEIGGRWTASEASRHINDLELEAAFFALKSLILETRFQDTPFKCTLITLLQLHTLTTWVVQNL